MKKSLLITASAYHTIVSVSSRCLIETGGVLVGILGDPLIIIAAGQPGANAIHHSVRFTTDPAEDLKYLSIWRQVHGPVIEIVGWYHKHYFLQVPSGGDLHQVRQLREDFKDNRPIIMGIVSESGLFRKSLKIRFFGLDNDGDQIEYDWDIISSNSPEIQKAIQSVPNKPEVKDTNFWNDFEFQSYKNPVGRQRICQDIEQLKQHGWNILTCRNKGNGLMMLQAQSNQADLRLILPSEYPLNPPVVFAGDNKRMIDLKTLREWNSMVTLMDVVTEAEQIQNCPLCRSRHLTAL
jgi:hypothetical protein